MSRKLMYAAGLLSCFSCEFELQPVRCRQPSAGTQHVVMHLSELVRTTPLDIMASAVLYFGELSGAAARLFQAYDEFLGLLDDRDRRAHLERLPPL